jgi:hypothetical protein
MGGRYKMHVYDQDSFVDELIGSFEMNAKDILGDKNNTFFWKNIYGAPKGCGGNKAEEMNESPNVASFWKGRILLHVEAVKTDKPFLRFEKIEGTDIKETEGDSDGEEKKEEHKEEGEAEEH